MLRCSASRNSLILKPSSLKIVHHGVRPFSLTHTNWISSYSPIQYCTAHYGTVLCSIGLARIQPCETLPCILQSYTARFSCTAKRLPHRTLLYTSLPTARAVEMNKQITSQRNDPQRSRHNIIQHRKSKYCTVLCCAVLCCTVLCNTVLC